MDTTYSHSYFGTESHEALECLPVQQRLSVEGFPKTRRNKPLEYVSPPGMASKYILSLPLPKILLDPWTQFGKRLLAFKST